jgi:hypothetical protein
VCCKAVAGSSACSRVVPGTESRDESGDGFYSTRRRVARGGMMPLRATESFGEEVTEFGRGLFTGEESFKLSANRRRDSRADERGGSPLEVHAGRYHYELRNLY